RAPACRRRGSRSVRTGPRRASSPGRRWSFPTRVASEAMRWEGAISARDGVDELAAGGALVRGLAAGLHALGVPENVGDLLGACQQLLGGLHTDLLLDGGGQLGCLPHHVMQVGMLFQV